MAPWLPGILLLEHYNGDRTAFLDGVYKIWQQDFTVDKPKYKGSTPCGSLVEQRFDGKERAFWHVVTEGDVERERTLDLDRCGRIRWPRAMIERSATSDVLTWQNERRGEERVLIALPDYSYLVVLNRRRTQLLLWTAYCVDRGHTRDKLRREYEQTL